MDFLSLGAGVQSSTLYLREKYELCIFADTQEEPGPVYTHLAYLQGLNLSPIVVRTAGKLGDDLQFGRHGLGKRFASIPAFTWDGAHVKKTRRQCTREYKLDVVHQAIREYLGLKPRQHFPKSIRITQAIGFSFDEQGRAGRTLVQWKRPQILPRFPLIEWRWTRERCVEFLRETLPHEVPRSSCVFCPYRTNQSWKWLRAADPAGWQRAVEIDRALRKPGNVVNRQMRDELFIHRQCVPLDEADLESDALEQQLSFEGCTGGCAA